MRVWNRGEASLVVVDGQRAVDALLKRDECLGGCDALDVLDAVVDQRHQVLVVAGIHFNHHGVVAGGEMALDDFLDLEQLGDNGAVHRASLERESDEGASRVSQQLGVDIVARTDNDPVVDEALDALVYSSTRHTANLSDIFARDARVVHYNFQNFLVKSVNFFHEIKFYLANANVTIFFYFAIGFSNIFFDFFGVFSLSRCVTAR